MISNEQYATYYGYYTKDLISASGTGLGTIPVPAQYSNNVSNGAVMFYAGEYNIYGPGGQMLSYMLDENGNYNKNYKILDQLGNTHIVLKNSEIVGSYMYEPFGKQFTLFSESQTRMSFIGKEKDIESELGDFGMRKYDSEIGRFTSIDPLWEKYYSWTPYHYCSNNPVMGSDPGGMAEYMDEDGVTYNDGNTEDKRKFTATKENIIKHTIDGNIQAADLQKVAFLLPDKKTFESMLSNTKANFSSYNDKEDAGAFAFKENSFVYGGKSITVNNNENAGPAILAALSKFGYNEDVVIVHSHPSFKFDDGHYKYTIKPTSSDYNLDQFINRGYKVKYGLMISPTGKAYFYGNTNNDPNQVKIKINDLEDFIEQ
jgi:RHS repeat-associated protein